MSQALPANPNLAWLKKAAKHRLAELRIARPAAKLHQAQRAIAQDYGFKSWRALKAHIDASQSPTPDRDRVFEAARAGDVETVRRAIASGFDPAMLDVDGRTIHQIAKELRHEALELLARQALESNTRSEEEKQAILGILSAAQTGDVENLRQRLDANPELVDALGGDGFQKAAALHLAVIRNQHSAIHLLIERRADLERRDFPDNATPLHLAAGVGDLETIRLLVDAGANVNAEGDDYALGVLGWATCLRHVRADVAAYLLDHEARLNLWAAISLDRADDVRAIIARDQSLLSARMTRNHHRRTPLHHAASKDRAGMVKLLLELGADPNTADATGATALTTASQENAGPEIVSALLAAGARLDFLTAVNLGRYDEASAMLRDVPSRIGPDGRDTIALHLAVNKRNLVAIRWLLAHGIDVNAKRMMWDCKHTALHMTVESGALDIARMLLDAGADPSIKDDKYKATALGWAEFFGREDFCKLLRERGGRK